MLVLLLLRLRLLFPSVCFSKFGFGVASIYLYLWQFPHSQFQGESIQSLMLLKHGVRLVCVLMSGEVCLLFLRWATPAGALSCYLHPALPLGALGRISPCDHAPG